MTGDDFDRRTEAVRARYTSTLGGVPGGVQDRLRLAREFGRLPTEEALAALRHIVLTANPLGARVQQLVHFGQLLSLGREHPARIHQPGRPPRPRHGPGPHRRRRNGPHHLGRPGLRPGRGDHRGPPGADTT
ncbi:hypothetical protein ACFSNO_29860 [Streptomyces cirratus]